VLAFPPGQVILAMNDRLIHFSLSPDDFGQLIDGLIARQEAWAKTAAWHRGELNDPYFTIEDSKDEREAQWIAERYAEILLTLRTQARGQRQ
jgi:hypothetical protein